MMATVGKVIGKLAMAIGITLVANAVAERIEKKLEGPKAVKFADAEDDWIESPDQTRFKVVNLKSGEFEVK